MSFIDDGVAKRKEIQQQAKLIAEQAPKVYEDLWDRVNRFINEAKRKGFLLSTNGSLHNKLVELRIPAKYPELADHRDHFRLTLDSPKGRIYAKGQSGVNFEFVLDVCGDGVVCLKWNGGRIETEDAAILILKQFLFSDVEAASAS